MKNRFYPSANRAILIAALIINFISAKSTSGDLSPEKITRCAAMENLERLKTLDPELETRMQEIEKQTQDWININATMKTGDPSVMGTIYKIPVVVHIVYNTSAQNITDAQVQSQIVVLNEDFRRSNADKVNTPSAFASLAADAEIEFCLASVSPAGGSTNGIIRKFTSTASFTSDDKVKYSSYGGDDAWPSSQYLNIWVCNLGGGLLGYAQFPGGPSATDGVVINYQYFGKNGSALAPYNKGRTATHEVGHWLNLYHIWGDDGTACTGSDQVSDTPNQAGENYGCPSYPKTDGCSSSSGVMFMNYMDYTDDACMNMFSAGQKARMGSLFSSAGARASLLTSNGCGGSTVPSYCSANGNSVSYEWINNVTLNTINNTTSGTSGGYANYTSISTSLAKNSAYTISLTPAFASSTYTEYFKVYIDYNKDLDFSDAGENIFTSSGSSSAVSGSFTVPPSAVIGTTRMRVIMSDGAISSACGSFSYGEVEDYSITITASTSSSCGTPSGLSASSVSSSSASLNWSSVSGAASYNLRYRPVSSSAWITATSSGTSKNVNGLSASTQYEFQAQAVCSMAGSFSASSFFTTTSSTSTSASNTVQVGSGTGTVGAHPYGTYYMDERVQYILTQAELVAGGFTSANNYIHSLAFYTTSASGQTMNGFTIKLAHVSASSFGSTTFITGTGATIVYSSNASVGANAWNTYNFTTAFNYDGMSNLLIEICWNNSSYTNNSSVQYTATSSYRSLYYRADVTSGGVCGNAAGTRSYNRPNMKMLFSSSPAEAFMSGRYAGEVEVAGGLTTSMNVYPNPASSNVTIGFLMTQSKEINVTVMDMLGRTSAEKKLSAAEGENVLNLDVSVFKQGVYIITINDDGNSEKRRLIISR